VGLGRQHGRKSGYAEAEERFPFWRGITLDMDTRLRVGRAIGKSEEQVAHEMMGHRKERGHPEAPPAMATDGKGDYRSALLDSWGQVPPYQGRGRPPTLKQPQPEWQSVQGVKERSGNQVTGVHIKVVYGDPSEVLNLMGGHSA